MKRIKLLPNNLINQIAAGEVIERPASVVKELVENSVDAGAKKIEIEISNECRNIRVADNGSGIHKDDVMLAFSRHATSKIQKENDLWNISTLGFRGEALASIISVSKMICTTKTADLQTGIKVECENSEVKMSETGCAMGTIMEVKNLFYNTPVRLKFLKKPQTEFAAIVEALQSIAISYTDVAFTLIQNDHTSFKTTGSSDIETVISEVYSKDLIRELAQVGKEDVLSNLHAYGYASNPDFTRSNKKAVYTFVNGRTIKCPIILKAIDTAYKDLIPNGRFPFVVLNLKLPANEVDVNVHPAKRDVRFVNANQIYGFVYASIKEALGNVKPNFINVEENQEKHSYAYFTDHNSSVEDKKDFEQFKTINSAWSHTSNNFSANVEKSMDFYKPFEQTKIDLVDVDNFQTFDKPKIIGQLFNTYILIEAPEGLQVVDQHIAHERYLYEKLKNAETFASQLLFTSDTIEVEPSEMSLIAENKEKLEKFGYSIEAVNDKQVVFKQIPQMLVGRNPEKIIFELLEALKGSLDSIEDAILISTACHAAVKANEKLSIWQMEELIANWMSTKYLKTCPHGRKISYVVPSKEIASFFGRADLHV